MWPFPPLPFSGKKKLEFVTNEISTFIDLRGNIIKNTLKSVNTNKRKNANLKPTAIQSTSNNSQHMNINEESVNSNMNLIGHLVPEVSNSLNENSINIPDPEVSDNLSVNSANIPVPGVSDNLSIISKLVPEAISGKNSIACRFHLANKCIKKSDCTFVHPCMSF